MSEEEEQGGLRTMDTYKQIEEFLHTVRLANLSASLTYCGIELDPVYGENKEMVIEALLLIIDHVAMEDFVAFCPAHLLARLLRKSNLEVTESEDENVETLLELLFRVRFPSYLRDYCSPFELALICQHLDIPVEPADSTAPEGVEDDYIPPGETASEDSTPLPTPYPIVPEAVEMYTNWILEEVTLRGLRAILFEQSLHCSREWMRDLAQALAGARPRIHRCR